MLIFWPEMGVTMTTILLKTEVVSVFFIVVIVSIDLPKISIKTNQITNPTKTKFFVFNKQY